MTPVVGRGPGRWTGLTAPSPGTYTIAMKLAVVVALELAMLSRGAFAQHAPRSNGERAQLLAGARVSLAANGPWLPIRAKFEQPVEVQDSSGPRLRFFDGLDDMSLLLYADRDGLQTVTLTAAAIYPTEAAAAAWLDGPSAGFMPDAGTAIQSAKPAKPGLVKVTLVLRGGRARVEVRGYTPASSLGKAYVPGGTEQRFTPDVLLPRSYRLLDAPGGNPFVFVSDAGRITGQVLARKGSHALVRTAYGPAGWIAGSQTRPLGDHDPATDQDDDGDANGVEGGVLGGMERAPTLPWGTVLYDAIDGQPVGEVGHGFIRGPSKRDGDWSRFDVVMAYGKVSVWARMVGQDVVAQEVGDEALPGAGPPSPPAPTPPGAVNLTPAQFQALRVGGERPVEPDEASKLATARAGKDRLVTAFKVCIDVTGAITSVAQVMSSGIAPYDDQVRAAIRTWSYRPYVAPGAKARRACGDEVVTWPAGAR